MSVQNPERLATKQDLKDMYDRIRPYMGGLVTSKAGFTPIGTIISVMGTTAPVNYLACDGTVYNIADYTELANYFNEQFGSINFFGGDGTTTFAVPDLRGEFLRGTGTNSHTNQGSGASVGVHQDATAVPNFWIGGDGNTFSWYGKTGAGIIEPDTEIIYNTDATRKNVTSSSTGGTGNEQCKNVRPTNTSVLYCIATKNFYIDPTLDYSTDEKVVGIWIDNKPIYQKTVDFGSDIEINNTSMWTRTTISATSIDKYISAIGINTSGAVFPLMASTQEGVVSLQVCRDNAKANVRYCTIQYTKTTT